jgi:hypothetical protein
MAIRCNHDSCVSRVAYQRGSFPAWRSAQIEDPISRPHREQQRDSLRSLVLNGNPARPKRLGLCRASTAY